MTTPTPFQPTDDERAYMKAPMTADEKTATKGMPLMVAHGWVTRHRAHYLAGKRQDARTELISEALMKLAKALQ